MKIKSYKILFRIFSFLSDKTNGAQLFVKYKLLLGRILIGLTTTSCNRQKNIDTCYYILPDNDSSVISNQDSVPSENKDSIPQFKPPVITPDTLDVMIEPITCYMPAMPLSEVPMIEESKEAKIYNYGMINKNPIPLEGDLEKFIDRVNSDVQYSERMLSNEEQGRVTVRITIDKEGNLSNIEVLKTFSEDAQKEAVRVLSASPKWIPGEHNGQKEEVKIVFPVTFRLPQD